MEKSKANPFFLQKSIGICLDCFFLINKQEVQRGQARPKRAERGEIPLKSANRY